jgi:DNA-binding response OmpR family regulator
MSETTTRVADQPAIKGKLRIDFNSQSVSVGNKLLKLSPREYDLLHHLVNNAGIVLSNQVLMEEVFPEHGADTQFLEVYINRLRDKLEENPNNPTIILNEGGTGYKFVG